MIINEIQLNIENLIAQEIPQAIMSGLEDALQLLENEAKERCPVDDGTLKAHITHSKEQNGDTYNGTVGSNTEYAPYVHEGTGIYAREGNGRQTPWSYKDVKGKRHTMKGQKPKPFLQEAFDSKLEEIKECFEGMLDH